MLESDRVLRTIIGPVLLVLWLVCGAYFVEGAWSQMPTRADVKDFGLSLGAVAAAGAVVVAVGYVMSSLTVLVLRALTWDVELPIKPETLETMRKTLSLDAGTDIPSPSSREDRLALVVTYQARHWDAIATKWAERRWLNIGICANAMAAMLLSLILWYPVYRVHPSAFWVLATLLFIGVFTLRILFNRWEFEAMHRLGAEAAKEKTRANCDEPDQGSGEERK